MMSTESLSTTGGVIAAAPTAVNSYEMKIMQRFAISDRGRPGDKWLAETVRWAWRTKIQVHLNIDLRMRLWTAAETEAVRVFASNLRDLLLAAPAGARLAPLLYPGKILCAGANYFDHLAALRYGRWRLG